MAKILVVDDDPDFVRITRRILEQNGYGVASAASGDEALKAMRKDKPDLVLLDIMMSYIIDGLDVSREMQKDPELKDIPVIMVTQLTGVRGEEMFPGGEYIPAETWISKPVKPQELLEKVKQLLAP